MSTSGIEANSPSQELGKLGALLSDLEANWGKGQNSPPALSVSELKELLAAIEESISDLEQRIASNRELQSSLTTESCELKKEIRQLSKKLAEEVSQLTKSTKRL